MLVDASGNLICFSLWPGQLHDSVGALPLLENLEFEAPLGDKAFDNDTIRAALAQRAAEAVIPPKPDRKTSIPHDPIKHGCSDAQGDLHADSDFRASGSEALRGTTSNKLTQCVSCGILLEIAMSVLEARVRTANHLTHIKVTLPRKE